mmetsp:Transcript_16862/g.20695  ORF Transcript_16862/g.20695 Transcript_16862/m.20695 type:complete len:503 (+) Transcript_16862:113-1621(+)
MRQADALNILKLGKNVILTGAAGAGKTYVLNQYLRYLYAHNVSCAVTASTGIAATHLNGQTVHSWSGLGTHATLTKDQLETICSIKRVKQNVKKAKVLVIDEISMLDAERLDSSNMIVQKIREDWRPFGGLQVVLCGDFFQLPPVTRADEVAHFAFEGSAWKKGDFLVCYLDEQYRQVREGEQLLKILNQIRSGQAGEHTKELLRACYKRELVSEEGEIQRPTRLYARNFNVDAINERELTELPGEVKSFTMETSGFAAHIEALKRYCLAPAELRLKTGAEVIFVKNDINGRYVNGSRGRVIGFEAEDGAPIVKLLSGRNIYTEPDEWTYEELGIVRARITQYPLRLAWAITIHKSQGMTLEAAEINLSDAFEPGMGYVALSRVRSLDGLRLMGLNDMALQVHPKVLAYDQDLRAQSEQAQSEISELSSEQLKAGQDKVLFGRFDGHQEATAKEIEQLKNARTDRLPRKPGQPKVPSHMLTAELVGKKTTTGGNCVRTWIKN